MIKAWDEDAWIDKKNRLVYRIVDNVIQIIQCRTHYGEK